MMTMKQKLELTWIGKDIRPRLEPRILIEDSGSSYHARFRFTESDNYDNRLIFGDNLLALKSLEQELAGKVKCVFIDPPYNTGSAFTHYDDGLEHSIWLSLMRDRLELIRRLLSPDGSLWITIDDNEVHYLKVLLDETFGRSNFIANMIWEKRLSRENRRAFSFNHDHILLYGKDKNAFEAIRNPLGLTQEVLARYKNPDNDPRGPWQSVSINAQAGHATASQFYELRLPSGRILNPPKGRCWLYTRERIEEEIRANNIWFGPDGDSTPRAKKFLSDSEDKGLTPETIWPAAEVGTNDEAKKTLLALLHQPDVFDNPKPEGLLKRVIEIATNPGDLILDSFAGSGTTGAVAQKMGRRWIMVELGEHCHTHIIPRLKKVIDGEDPGGVTESTGWKGGGGFRYFHIAPSLLEKDRFGNLVISKQYNAAMLTEAMCKIMGFNYAPSDEIYWQQASSTESDFLYVTTQTLSREQLAKLSDEVGDNRSLLVCCAAFRGKADAFQNLTIKKIPSAVLAKFEWGHDDYSLKVANLPKAAPPAEAIPADAAKPPTPKQARRRAAAAQPNLFSPVEQEGAE
jgi:adenine-specific DNA-methyltransferase